MSTMGCIPPLDTKERPTIRFGCVLLLGFRRDRRSGLYLLVFVHETITRHNIDIQTSIIVVWAMKPGTPVITKIYFLSLVSFTAEREKALCLVSSIIVLKPPNVFSSFKCFQFSIFVRLGTSEETEATSRPRNHDYSTAKAFHRQATHPSIVWS